MAFPTTSAFFRKSVIDALKSPVAGTTVDLDGALKLALYTNAISGWNFDTDTGYTGTWGTTNEVTNSAGTGYTAGGAALGATPTLTAPGTAGGGTITYGFGSSNGATWAGPCTLTAAAQGGMLYDSGSGKGIVAVYFSTALNPTAGTMSVTWASTIWTLT